MVTPWEQKGTVMRSLVELSKDREVELVDGHVDPRPDLLVDDLHPRDLRADLRQQRVEVEPGVRQQGVVQRCRLHPGAVLVEQERTQAGVREVVLTERTAPQRGVHRRGERADLHQEEGRRLTRVPRAHDGVERLPRLGHTPVEVVHHVLGQPLRISPVQRPALFAEEGEEVVLQNGLGERAEPPVAVRVEGVLVGPDLLQVGGRQVEGLQVVDVAKHAVAQQAAQLEDLLHRHRTAVVQPGQVVRAHRTAVGVVLRRQFVPLGGPERGVGRERLEDVVGVVSVTVESEFGRHAQAAPFL